jgi:hypothetical protein
LLRETGRTEEDIGNVTHTANHIVTPGSYRGPPETPGGGGKKFIIRPGGLAGVIAASARRKDGGPGGREIIPHYPEKLVFHKGKQQEQNGKK